MLSEKEEALHKMDRVRAFISITGVMMLLLPLIFATSLNPTPLSSEGGPSSSLLPAAYAAADTTTTAAQTSYTSKQTISAESTLYVPCAAEGQGEDVYFTGNQLLVKHLTVDSQGNWHFKMGINNQGVRGTGLVTGDKYQWVDASQSIDNIKVDGTEYTNTVNIGVIGQGNGNNFLIHETLHVTVNSDKTVTVTIDNFSTECK